MYGKSIGARAPGLFVELLRRKAEKAGGSVTEFNTQTTALSQVCICGAKVKKPLSQRIHSCECGVKQQRDIYSAYLALFVVENKLDYIATKDIQNLSSSSKKILGLREAEIEGLANLISEKTIAVSSI